MLKIAILIKYLIIVLSCKALKGKTHRWQGRWIFSNCVLHRIKPRIEGRESDYKIYNLKNNNISS